MPRPRTVYRGKRKYSWIITLTATVLVFLVLLAVWLFYDLQKYIVYDKDGLHLDLSAKRAALVNSGTQPEPLATQRPGMDTDVEIVVEQTDYSALQTSAGTDMQPVRAIYIPAAELRESTLTYYAASGNMGDFDALVLSLKGADGFLRWHSQVATADSFAVNGTLELQTPIAALKAQGVYLIAELSSLTDAAMAQRNAPIALKNADGSVYTDRAGVGYLDPYNDSTRAYLLALLTELRDLGFDEVLLQGFACPDDEHLRFSLAMTQTPDPASALASLALWLREQADSLGIKLSVVMDGAHLRGQVTAGQDPALLLRMFDRLVAETDAGNWESDLAAMEAALGGADERRLLTIADDFAPERESYIVK